MMIDTSGTTRRGIRGAVSMGTLVLALAGGCLPAQAQAVYAFDVPRGDLADVVTRIARTAGRPIVFPAGLARGRTAGPISGRESVEAALGQALAGTGLQVAPGAGGSLTIRPAAGPVAGVPAGADLAAIDVTDAGGIPGGSYGDQGFQAGDVGGTVRIADAPAREIPISVTAVTQKVLESTVTTTPTDAAVYSAGVNLAPGTNGIGRPTITIRGFSGAGYSVNGMPTNGSDQIPIDAVERVEVLKGPTSILNGSSDLGGLVNVSLKQPTSDTIRNVTVRYGSDNYKTIATDLGGRIEGLDGTTYRFIASANHADQNFAGYRDPHEFLVAPSVRWQGQDLTFDAGLRYSQARVVPSTFALLPTLGSPSGQLGPLIMPQRGMPLGNPYFGGTTENLTLFTKQSYELGRIFGMDVTLNNSFEWSKIGFNSVVPYAQGVVQNPLSPNVFNLNRVSADQEGFNRNERFDITMKYDSAQSRQTLKFGYDNLSQNLTADVISNGFSTDVTTGLPLVPRRNPVGFGFNQRFSTTTQGIYVIDKFDTLDDRLHILGSVRYDNFDSVSRTTYPALNLSIPSKSQTTAISWVAGAAFDLTPWMTIYGNRSNGSYPNGTYTTRSGALLPPEVRDLAEVGARYALFDKRLNLTTSFFDLVRTNIASPDLTDPTGRTSILVAGQTSKGMEIEAQGEILPGLNLIGSLTSQTFDPGPVSSQVPNTYLLYGLPKKLYSLWATYTLQDTPLAGLTFGAGVRYVGDFQITNGGLFAQLARVQGYNTFDAAISYEGPDYTVSLKLNNIFNKYAIAPAVTSSYIGVIQGRNAMLQATYRF